MKEIRDADPEGQGRWSFTSRQQTLRRLNKAFEAFFRRIRAGERPGYPRFKGKGWFDTITLVEGDGARWDCRPHHPAATYVRVQGVGHLRVHQHRPIAGRVKQIEIKREGSRWYVICSCDDVPAAPLPATGREVGLDMGVAHFATVSEPIDGLTDEGGHIANPRYLKTAQENWPPRSGLMPVPDAAAPAGRGPPRRSDRSTARWPGNGPTTRTRPRWAWSGTRT